MSVFAKDFWQPPPPPKDAILLFNVHHHHHHHQIAFKCCHACGGGTQQCTRATGRMAQQPFAVGYLLVRTVRQNQGTSTKQRFFCFAIFRVRRQQ